jgi:hypothetical protein
LREEHVGAGSLPNDGNECERKREEPSVRGEEPAIP